MFASMLKNWEGSIQRFASIPFINHIFWARKNSKFQNTWFFIFKYDETLTKPSCFGSKHSFRSMIGHPRTKIDFHHTLYFFWVSKYVFSSGFREIFWWDHLSSRAYLQIRQSLDRRITRKKKLDSCNTFDDSCDKTCPTELFLLLCLLFFFVLFSWYFFYVQSPAAKQIDKRLIHLAPVPLQVFDPLHFKSVYKDDFAVLRSEITFDGFLWYLGLVWIDFRPKIWFLYVGYLLNPPFWYNPTEC